MWDAKLKEIQLWNHLILLISCVYFSSQYISECLDLPVGIYFMLVYALPINQEVYNAAGHDSDYHENGKNIHIFYVSLTRNL